MSYVPSRSGGIFGAGPTCPHDRITKNEDQEKNYRPFTCAECGYNFSAAEIEDLDGTLRKRNFSGNNAKRRRTKRDPGF